MAAELPKHDVTVDTSITEAKEKFDRIFTETRCELIGKSGTRVLVGVIWKDKLFLAYRGESRAAVGVNVWGNIEANQLTERDRNNRLEEVRDALQRKHEKKKMKHWVDLPEDILELIHNKLHYSDQVRFCSVCMSWRISENRLRCLDHLPWSLHYAPTSNACAFEYKLFDPYSERVNKVLNSEPKFDTSISFFREKTVYGSKFGWILSGAKTHNDLFLYLHNPFTGQVISLPHLGSNCIARAATFTTDPVSSSECEILVLFKGCVYRNNE